MKTKTLILGLAVILVAAVVLIAQVRINPTDPQPTCNMCPGTYIPVSELEAYTKKALAENLLDQQVRDIEIGKAHVGIGMVYRGKLDQPGANSVAEHDQVSEVYHIISGSATLMLGLSNSSSNCRDLASEHETTCASATSGVSVYRVESRINTGFEERAGQEPKNGLR